MDHASVQFALLEFHAPGRNLSEDSILNGLVDGTSRQRGVSDFGDESSACIGDRAFSRHGGDNGGGE